MKEKILNALIAFDIWVMRTFFGGLPGETLSAAAWNSKLTGKWGGRIFVPVINFIFWPVQRDHCRMAWLWQRDIYTKDPL